MDHTADVPERLELFEHQSRCIDLAYDRPYYGLLLDMGLGKTRIVIELIKRYKTRDPGFRTLVVAPNTILDNWSEEVAKWSTLRCVILRGSKKKRLELLHSSRLADIYVINYEALKLLEDDLKEAKYSMCVLDECQKVKNARAQQSKSAFKIGQTVPRRLILSGTICPNSPLDLFGSFKFLSPFILGFSFYKFRSQYAIMGGYGGYQVKQWINLNKLHDIIYKYAVRYRKEDCLDLPDKLYETVKVEMPKEQRGIYDTLKKSFIVAFKDGHITAPQVLTRLLRFSQITAGFAKLENGQEIAFTDSPKLQWLREFLEDLPKDKKVVVFIRFIKELQNVQNVLNDLKIKHVSIYGGVTGQDRQDNVRQFNQDAHLRVLIGQLDTAGLGINLTAAHYCVFLSNNYNYGARIQCEDRLHRIGQDKNVTYFDIIMKDSIDEAIIKALKMKQSLAEYVVESKGETV